MIYCMKGCDFPINRENNMFNFFKKNKDKDICKLVAVVEGKTIPLSEVADPVFAQKMAGDGVAIEPTGDVIVAPADGELTLVFETKHAFAMTLDNGIELLVHVGIDTVNLKGEGFEQLAEAGKHIKAGTPILKIDRELLKSKNVSLTTPVLITNVDKVNKLTAIEGHEVQPGETVVLEYTIKSAR